MKTKRERSCARCGTGFTGRGNRALYCDSECKRQARNDAQNHWNEIKRQLVPMFRDLADDDPASFWEGVRSNQDILSVYPEVRRLSHISNGKTGWDDSEGETGKSGARYMPADPDRPDIDWSAHNWTKDNFLDNDLSLVPAGSGWRNVWIKLENVTHLTSSRGEVWQLDGRLVDPNHPPCIYPQPLKEFSTIDKREGCKSFVNGFDCSGPVCQPCAIRSVTREHSERNTHPADDLCLHDLVPDWCAFCTGKSVTPFVHESDNWIETTRLLALTNTPKGLQYHVEHEALPGNSIARGNSTSGGEGHRTDLDLLADATG